MREGGVRMSSLSPYRWHVSSDNRTSYSEWYHPNGVSSMYMESTPYYTHVATQSTTPWQDLAEQWSSDEGQAWK